MSAKSTTRGKYNRAEPVAALYEQLPNHHAGAFDALEEELMAFGGEMEAAGPLDRADALVWAVTDLLVDAPDGERGPRVRWCEGDASELGAAQKNLLSVVQRTVADGIKPRDVRSLRLHRGRS